MRELFADDLPHLLGSYRLLCSPDVLRKRLIDKRLIPDPPLHRLSLECSEDLVIDVDRDAGLALRWNRLPAAPFGEVVLSLFTLLRGGS